MPRRGSSAQRASEWTGGGGDSSPIPLAEAVLVSPHNEYSARGGVSEKSEDMRNKKESSKKSGGAKGGTYSSGPPKLNREKSLSEKDPPNFPPQSRSSSLAWPKSLVREVVGTFERPVNAPNVKKFLGGYNWCKGMQSALITNCKKVPIRFFIIDDSGSMITNDGNKIIRTNTDDIDGEHGVSGKMKKHKAKMVQCTRWAELKDSMSFAAELSEAAMAPSEFRLLNGAEPVIVGLGDDNHEGLEFAKEVLDEDPAGQTPLCQHVNNVVGAIEAMAPELRRLNKKAAVIIATDGESTDGKVSKALEPLRKLPAFVVIRLCTDSPKIVDYWNNIDQELELEMDVIDDLVQDAEQVKVANPWLIYGEELHRLREFGACFKEMDLIDESLLGAEQMQKFLKVMFDRKELPHPQVEWGDFHEDIKRENDLHNLIFDPLSASFRHQVDLVHLRKIYGDGKASDSSAVCTIS